MVNALKSEQTLMQEKLFGDGCFAKYISVSVYINWHSSKTIMIKTYFDDYIINTVS